MARSFTEPKLVLATHNPGKVVEIAALLEPFGVEVVSAGELGLPEPEETEATFEGNARLKAHAAARAANLPALSDDSGLAVSGLGGAPGIYWRDGQGRARTLASRWRGLRPSWAITPTAALTLSVR